jgi:hypothetical protein
MKKSIYFIQFFFTILVACKGPQGEVGPKGDTGATGVIGAAGPTAVYYDSRIVFKANNTYDIVGFTFPTPLASNDIAVGFIKKYPDDSSLAELWFSLPFNESITNGVSNYYSVSLTSIFYPTAFWVLNQKSISSPAYTYLRVVVIKAQKGSRVAIPEEVDLNTYESVAKYYHLSK